MKLKLKTTSPAPVDPSFSAAPADSPAQSPAISTPVTAGGTKLKLKVSVPSAAPAPDAEPAEAPKRKRKYTRKPKLDENGEPLAAAPKAAAKPSKKRAREENSNDPSQTSKRRSKPTVKALQLNRDDEDDDDDDDDDDVIAVAPAPRPPPLRTQSMKISLKTGKAMPPQPQRTGTALLRIKGHAGRVPIRPPGVGYDSEAEDAEEDPALENQFILRMEPGPDCDALRKAIEDKTIGKKIAEGGCGIGFRFLDREGRRTIVMIKTRLYAATMVDLPCVIESMKSWNKKDWVKTADICQLLLVLGQVKDEEEARKYPLPNTVEPSSHQFAHGLTPPMHWVRKRRFRPRVSYRRIEEVEAKVDELLADDTRIAEEGGKVEYQVLNKDRLNSDDDTSSEESEDEDDEDDGMVNGGGYIMDGVEVGTPMQDALDPQDLENQMMAALEDEMFGDGDGAAEEGDQHAVSTPATATSHDVAMHALGLHDAALPTAETPRSNPETETESTDDNDDDEEEDGESEEDEVVDEGALAMQREQEMAREEIKELEKEIHTAWEQHNRTTNIPFQKKIKQKIERLTTDLDVKKRMLGDEVD